MGGPAGKVVGINTMIVSGGIALVIPGATVEEFVRHGPSPRLGVIIRPVRVHRRNGLGLLILGIDPGSPAERASLFIGDVLICAGNTELASPTDLSDAIGGAPSGFVKLRFVRGDSPRGREVVISLSGRFTREAA